jgi:hypothetical protein
MAVSIVGNRGVDDTPARGTLGASSRMKFMSEGPRRALPRFRELFLALLPVFVAVTRVGARLVAREAA